MSKRYREAFKETICHCRRKRNLNITTCGIHQSYYSNKAPRAFTTRSASRPTTSSSSDRSHVIRSDTIQTQVSLSLTGQNDEVYEPQREHLLPEINQTSRCEKLWTEDRNKPICCHVCVSEQGEKLPSPRYERQGLLLHTSSADSAC